LGVRAILLRAASAVSVFLQVANLIRHTSPLSFSQAFPAVATRPAVIGMHCTPLSLSGRRSAANN
jgi:hypothetical protein